MEERVWMDWRPFAYGGLASIIAEFGSPRVDSSLRGGSENVGNPRELQESSKKEFRLYTCTKGKHSKGTFPLDTTKTRLQVQGQKYDAKHACLRYSGMTDALIQISKQEGVRALYSGFSSAVLRQATYGTIKFGTYYSLKQAITEKWKTGDTVLINIVCAAVAGVISSAIATPTDVVKIRMQVTGLEANMSLLGCFQDVYHHEGIRGLWRGAGPTAQRAAIIAAVELPIYDFSKNKFMERLGDSVNNHFISSFIASMGSAIASTPIDVIRTRLMNQRRVRNAYGHLPSHIYSGSVDCFVQTFKHEGFFALYKGFIPTWFRMGPWNIIFFITYEQLKCFY